MNLRSTLLAAYCGLVAATCSAANEWPQIFEGTKGDEYVFLMLHEDGRATYLQRAKRHKGDIWLIFDADAKWDGTADAKARPNLSVTLKGLRFDYFWEKDRLTEWDKMGPQRILKKQRNRAIHE